MKEQFQRTEMLFGTEAMRRLAASHVAVFGVGGVGGHVVEALARSGVGELTLVDADTVDITNLNRQIIALHSTVGRAKTDVARERVSDINPDCRVHAVKMFYLPDNADQLPVTAFDYVVDCIDTVKAKLELIRRCRQAGVPVISSMGAAGKLHPDAFHVMDLSKTQNDPLAKVIRRTLRKEGILHVKVVCSDELPVRISGGNASDKHVNFSDGTANPSGSASCRPVPASNAFVPPAAGLLLASEVVYDLIR